jgi:SAM-dependent methyltransferase
MKLNLGCGGKRIDGYIGVDRYPTPAVDVIGDVTERLPFDNSSVDEILLDNVIEHVVDIPRLMREMHRICRNDALLVIHTPHFTSLSSWRDPTHVHHLSYYSFDHFTREQVAHYTSRGDRFELVERHLSFGGVMGNIGRLIFMISPQAYEKNWCFMFRASTLTVKMRVIKNDHAS